MTAAARGRLGGLVVALAGAVVWPAQAQVCMYFDGEGVAHIASDALDSRFQCWGPSGRTFAGRVPGKAHDMRELMLTLQISPEAKALQPLIRKAAQAHGLDAELLTAIIAVESGFDAGSRSPRGALGLMQIRPSIAAYYAQGALREQDPNLWLLSPQANIETGARILADLSRRMGRIDSALAAWNAGEGKVRRHGGGVPDIAETRAHVHLVLELYWALLQARQARLATQFRVHSPARSAPAF